MNYYLGSGTDQGGFTGFLYSAEIDNLDYLHKSPLKNESLSFYKLLLVFVFSCLFTSKKEVC